MLKTILARLRNAVKVTGLILLALIIVQFVMSMTRWHYLPPTNSAILVRVCRYTGYAETCDARGSISWDPVLYRSTDYLGEVWPVIGGAALFILAGIGYGVTALVNLIPPPAKPTSGFDPNQPWNTVPHPRDDTNP